jgi:transcriptional regulator with XRE-family HTH domain
MDGQRPAENAQLLNQAGLTLAMSHGQLAKLLGVSRRSVSRWIAEGTWISVRHAKALAEAVHAGNRPLAARFAGLAGKSLVELGLEAPAAAAPVAPAPTSPDARTPKSPDATKLLDAVVCAAAEAMDASPRAVRPALLAAVKCAREVGLTLEAMDAMLHAQRAASASAGLTERTFRSAATSSPASSPGWSARSSGPAPGPRRT